MAELTQSYRLDAIKMLSAVVKDGRSLGELIRSRQQSLDAREAARLQELTYGTIRWSYRIEGVMTLLLKKPLRNKDTDVKVLLWLAIYEIEYMRTPDYAVVNSYAVLTNKLRKGWAKSLVNGTLREFLRTKETLLAKADVHPPSRYSVPSWLFNSVTTDWPEHAAQYFDACNRKAPLVLRVNAQRTSRKKYVTNLETAGLEATNGELGRHAIVLPGSGGVRVEALPGFDEGHFAVQDSAAQLAAELINPAPGERVLDACAAPGGKTTHLSALQPDIRLTAIDNDANRLQRVADNLHRLGHEGVTLRCADVAELSSWWDQKPFDAILLDAPCSALGVLRRHPDIRRLRRDSDIAALAAIQLKLLTKIWPTLVVGGRLLYSTCSVLRQENEQVVGQFIREQVDARQIEIDASWGQKCRHGRQILPGQHNSDGFYYAILARQ